MKAATRITRRALPRLVPSSRPSPPTIASSRPIHSSTSTPADVAPFYSTGPPPEPPQPAVEHPYAKIERRRKQAELLKHAKELRDVESGKSSGKLLRKRFWKDVHIKEVDGMDFSHLPPPPHTTHATQDTQGRGTREEP